MGFFGREKENKGSAAVWGLRLEHRGRRRIVYLISQVTFRKLNYL